MLRIFGLAREIEEHGRVPLGDAGDLHLWRHRRRWGRLAAPNPEPDGGDGNEELRPGSIHGYRAADSKR